MRNTVLIEQDAIVELKRHLTISDKIIPYISENDRTPAYDGNLYFLIEPQEMKRGTFIPVQVKGKDVTEFVGSTSKRKVDIKDLITYKSNRGCLFFEVQLLNRTESRVYFEYLLPSDVDMYIKKKKGSKSSGKVTIKMKHLDTTSKELVEDVLKTFISEADIQNSKTLNLDDISGDIGSNLKVNMNLSLSDIRANMIEEALLGKEVYVHSSIEKDGKINDFATRVILTGYEKEQIGVIKSGEKVIANKYKIIKQDDLSYIEINDGFKFGINNDNISFQDTGSLKRRLTNYDILETILTNQEITVNDVNLINGIKVDSTDYVKRLRFLRNVEKVLQYFGYDGDLLLDTCSDKDYGTLYLLIDVLLNKQLVPLGNTKPGMYDMEIGEIHLTVFVIPDADNNIVFHNPFSKEFDDKILKLTNDVEGVILYNQSVYFVLNKELMLQSSTIDYKVIKDRMMKIESHTTSLNHVNQLGLEMIHVYDVCKSRNVLECSQYLFDELYHASNQVQYLVNAFQVKSRLGTLSDDDIRELIELKNTELRNEYIDHTMVWAYCTVLKNIGDAKYHFSFIKEVEKNELKSYPIYSLYVELLK